MDGLFQFLSSLDFRPLWISLKTGIAATIISFFLGILAARLVISSGNRTRALLDGLLTMPLVLPPTVAGFILLRVFSLRRPFGSFLYTELGIKVVQTWGGCVVAAVIISFPLMYRSARAAFEQVDETLIAAGRTLGISEREIFWKIRVPLAKPGILSGTVLAFARSIGEFGATAMLAGNIAGKTSTVSQRIAMVVQDGDYRTAGFWVVVIIVVAAVIVIGMNLIIKDRKDVSGSKD